MKYKIYFLFIILLLFGCGDNNPITNKEENHFELEYIQNNNSLAWIGYSTLIGSKVAIALNDSIKYYDLYSDGLVEEEKLILKAN